MYIVTEYGIADVFCKPIPDRVKALIAIAHPDFRDDLKKQALEAGLIKG
jgi:acyl-CoA hydrolase